MIFNYEHVQRSSRKIFISLSRNCANCLYGEEGVLFKACLYLLVFITRIKFAKCVLTIVHNVVPYFYMNIPEIFDFNDTVKVQLRWFFWRKHLYKWYMISFSVWSPQHVHMFNFSNISSVVDLLHAVEWNRNSLWSSFNHFSIYKYVWDLARLLFILFHNHHCQPFYVVIFCGFSWQKPYYNSNLW